jgi:hypothetical protein
VQPSGLLPGMTPHWTKRDTVSNVTPARPVHRGPAKLFTVGGAPWRAAGLAPHHCAGAGRHWLGGRGRGVSQAAVAQAPQGGGLQRKQRSSLSKVLPSNGLPFLCAHPLSPPGRLYTPAADASLKKHS